MKVSWVLCLQFKYHSIKPNLDRFKQSLIETFSKRLWLSFPKLSDCRGLPASGCVAADTRKMLFRYSELCGTVSDAVDAVITPEADKDRQSRRGSNFKNINPFNSSRIKEGLTPFKI